MKVLRSLVLIGLATHLGAQESDPAALAGLDARANIQSATVVLRTLRTTSKAGAAVNAEVDKLLDEGAGFLAAGNTGEVRRRIYHAYSLLGGKSWTPTDEYAAALLLRTDTEIADPARRLVARLDQIYPAAYQPKTALRLRVTVHEPVPARSGPRPGKLLLDAGIMDGVSRDLIDEPFAFDADISGCGEGPRVLAVELLDGTTSIRKLWIPINLVSGMDAKRAEIERRLQGVAGHESAKATVLAPFDLARTINLGRREITRIDFAEEMRQSDELLTALLAGRDPLWQSVGNHKRHYDFTEAGEIMPYRVYVPKIYKPGARLPLVIALHGLGGTEDTFLGRDGALIATLAEKYGFIVAAPLGYRVNGQYGSTIARFTDAVRKRSTEFSEKDVMNVLRLVSEEYGTDPNRTYLMGHSMGGSGTWYLGAKYAEKWAAMAPIAGPTAAPNAYPFDRLKGMPVIACHGDADATVPVAATRAMVAGMKEHGLSPIYVEVPGASHGSVVAVVMPRIFEFFSRQSRQNP
jgi:poly(3-hydroxybutyrate) depolymerase